MTCKNWRKYKGLRPPTCLRGTGCDVCWQIWSRNLQRIVDPRFWGTEAFDAALKQVYAPAIKKYLETSSNLLTLFGEPIERIT